MALIDGSQIDLSSPGQIGNIVANAGAFTSLSATNGLQANLVIPGSYTTGTLPSASANPRAIAYDSTIGLLVTSNGTTWENIVPLMRSLQVLYGDVAPTTNITIPSNKRYRFRGAGKGGGAGSGAACTDTTLAIGGGGGGAGGFCFDITGFTNDLIALGASTLVVSLGQAGLGGAGVSGTASVANGNAGTKGGDTSLVINSIVLARALGGNFGSGGTTSGGSAGSSSQVGGGVSGGAGGAGSNSATAGSGSGSSSDVDSAAGGSGAAGYTISNSTGLGIAGSRGSKTQYFHTEANATVGGNANAALIPGTSIPLPGNGGGGGTPGGASATGGDGINGGGGGSSAASRTASSKGGDGGRSFAVIEFF